MRKLGCPRCQRSPVHKESGSCHLSSKPQFPSNPHRYLRVTVFPWLPDRCRDGLWSKGCAWVVPSKAGMAESAAHARAENLEPSRRPNTSGSDSGFWWVTRAPHPTSARVQGRFRCTSPGQCWVVFFVTTGKWCLTVPVDPVYGSFLHASALNVDINLTGLSFPFCTRGFNYNKYLKRLQI